MNIHEFQGQAILSSYGVSVAEGFVAETPDQAIMVAEELKKKFKTDLFVVKAQIHAGGRGKGGGVKIAKSVEEVGELAGRMIGMNLVTPQTGPRGKKVNKVLIARNVFYEGESSPKELYLSILLDRSTGRYMVVYSPEGGMSIEEVAEKTPHLIFREEINPVTGLQPFQARRIAFNLGLEGKAFKEMQGFMAGSTRLLSDLTHSYLK
jgi:succinyl-CoA synthetase beta subunit